MLSSDDTKKIRDRLSELVGLLDNSLKSEQGCLHENKESITTMGARRGLSRFICPDCDDELEIDND
jgi:transposase-like protein